MDDAAANNLARRVEMCVPDGAAGDSLPAQKLFAFTIRQCLRYDPPLVTNPQGKVNMEAILITIALLSFSSFTLCENRVGAILKLPGEVLVLPASKGLFCFLFAVLSVDCFGLHVLELLNWSSYCQSTKATAYDRFETYMTLPTSVS